MKKNNKISILIITIILFIILLSSKAFATTFAGFSIPKTNQTTTGTTLETINGRYSTNPAVNTITANQTPALSIHPENNKPENNILENTNITTNKNVLTTPNAVTPSITVNTVNQEITLNNKNKDYSDIFYIGEEYIQEDKNLQTTSSAYIITKKVKLSGTINGSLYICAEEIELSNLQVNGSTFICSKKATINDTVMNNLYSVTNELNLNKNTNILSNLYSATNLITISETSQIGKNKNIITKDDTAIPAKFKENNYNYIKPQEKTLSQKIVEKTLYSITIIVTILILSLIILNTNKETKNKLQQINKPGKVIILSLIALSTIIIVPILLGISLFIPILSKLGLILIISYILLLLLSQTYTLLWISTLITKKSNRKNGFIIFITFLLSIIYSCLSILTYGIISIIGIIIGIGLILNLIFTNKEQQDNEKKHQKDKLKASKKEYQDKIKQTKQVKKQEAKIAKLQKKANKLSEKLEKTTNKE